MIYLVRYALIVVYTILWGTLGVVLGLLDRSGESVIWVARNWITWVIRSCGIEIEVDGLENVDPAQPYVFMSNHQSVFDVAAVVVTIPCSWRFVAKRELTWIPFFGWSLALGGHVIIDRGRRDRAVRSLRRAARRVKEGTNVIIFPEGTRGDGEALGAFKSGGFHLATDAGVPILPISVSGSHRITPKRSLRIEPGRIHIRYGAPISSEATTEAERAELKAEVRRAIEAGMESETSAP